MPITVVWLSMVINVNYCCLWRWAVDINANYCSLLLVGGSYKCHLLLSLVGGRWS